MFKKTLQGICLLTLLMFIITAPASAITFEWDANTDDPDGYIIYFNEKGETDTPYNTAPVIHPTITITVEDQHIVPGVVYEAYATAYNERGESEKSNTVEFSIDAFTPPAENLPVILEFPSAPGTITVL